MLESHRSYITWKEGCILHFMVFEKLVKFSEALQTTRLNDWCLCFSSPLPPPPATTLPHPFTSMSLNTSLNELYNNLLHGCKINKMIFREKQMSLCMLNKRWKFISKYCYVYKIIKRLFVGNVLITCILKIWKRIF